jgi:hypothetical protein
MRAGDADPGSLLRRRRRDSALPHILYTSQGALRMSRNRRKTYGLPTQGRTKRLKKVPINPFSSLEGVQESIRSQND